MRPIDADIVIKDITAMKRVYDAIDLDGMIKGLEKAKTITLDDLRPHGRWVEWWPPAHMILTGEEKLYRCSSCDAKYAEVEGYKYCPYCGAEMDGSEDQIER